MNPIPTVWKKKSRSKMQLNALSFSFFWRFCWLRICEYVEWPHLQQWLLWWVNQVLRHHGWLIVNVLVWYVWLLNLWMRYRLIQELRRLSIPWWQRSRRQQWHRHVHLLMYAILSNGEYVQLGIEDQHGMNVIGLLFWMWRLYHLYLLYLLFLYQTRMKKEYERDILKKKEEIFC